MQKYLICHFREVRRYAWFEADTEEEAIEKAKNADDTETESDSKFWEEEDDDPGEFEVRET
jgi:hypothetical protein